MKYAVQRDDGTFTGVVYDSDSEQIRAHHDRQGQSLVPVVRLKNTGTDDVPVWQAVQPSIEDRRAAVVASRMQAKLALHEAGRLAEIEDAVSEADAAVKIAWADATEFRRDSLTIAALASALEPPMTDAELDDLFEAAAKISA